VTWFGFLISFAFVYIYGYMYSNWIFLIFRRRELSYTLLVSSVFGQGAGRRRRRSWLQSTWKWICKLEQWIIAFSVNISFFYLVYSFPLSVHATMLVSSGPTDFPRSDWLFACDLHEQVAVTPLFLSPHIESDIQVACSDWVSTVVLDGQ